MKVPKVKSLKEIKVDKNAIYGYSPKPSSSLGKFNIDFTNPKQVAKARKERLEYIKKQEIKKNELKIEINKLIGKGKSMQEIAKLKVKERNAERIQSYKNNNNKEGLKSMKERNKLKYGNENGPTYDYLKKQGKSDEEIIWGSFKVDKEMNLLLGIK